MAFYPTSAQYLDKDSIKAILEAEAEAGIADCMAAFFGSPNGVASMMSSADIATRADLFNTIMCAYSNKENSIACVLKASAKKLAADKNILPAYIDNPPSDCKCNC